MHNKFLKPILLTLLLTLSACSDTRENKKIIDTNKSNTTKKKAFDKPEYDDRLDNHEYGRIWYDTSDYDYESAYNIAVFYKEKYKAYNWAEFWYKHSWDIQKNKDTAFNLGNLYNLNLKKYDNALKWYKKSYLLGDASATFSMGALYKNILKDYDKSIIWYEKSYLLGDPDASNSLGYVYDTKLNNNKKAKEWYLKAITERESLSSLKNLGRLYHYKLKDDIKAVEYFISLINKKYSKEKVLNYLRSNWKLSEETIKKGYESQLKSKIIPEKLKYKGGL